MPFKDYNSKLEYRKNYHKNRLETDKEYRQKTNDYQRFYSIKRRKFLFKLLGNECVNCGISDYDVLNFDHINNDGKEDRGKKNKLNISYYYNHPDIAQQKLQILCCNCNYKKELFRKELERLERYGIPPF